jgi:muramidase (phage lysozyme)
MKGQGLKDVTQIKADTLVEGTQLKVDTDKAVSDAKRPAKRMAGVVAGLGTIATGYMLGQGKKEDAAEQAKRDKAWNERTEVLRALGNKKTEVRTPTAYKGPPKPTFITPGSSSTTETEGGTSVPVSSGGTGWSPLSKTIQFSEGTYKKDGTTNYNLGYGGNSFTDLSKHPDTVWHTDSGSSAAAGAYQFMPGTYSRVSTALGLKDFSPTSQEKAGEWLAQQRGVDTNKLYKTRAGLKAAFHAMSPEWAGLPNNNNVSHYDGKNGNKSMKFNNLVSFYEKQVGYTLK